MSTPEVSKQNTTLAALFWHKMAAIGEYKAFYFGISLAMNNLNHTEHTVVIVHLV